LNNILEQDHRGIKRLTGPGLGFGSFWTARRKLAGFEAMAMIRKGQVRKIDGRDMKAKAVFVGQLFGVAARLDATRSSRGCSAINARLCNGTLATPPKT
jgi:IS6 family transposase